MISLATRLICDKWFYINLINKRSNIQMRINFERVGFKVFKYYAIYSRQNI